MFSPLRVAGLTTSGMSFLSLQAIGISGQLLLLVLFFCRRFRITSDNWIPRQGSIGCWGCHEGKIKPELEPGKPAQPAS